MHKLVFVVDDDPHVAETVSLILKNAGYDVTIFFDPARLVKVLPTLNPRPDLLITDFQMPGINGLELIQMAVAHIPNLKTISISGSLMDEQLRAYPIQPTTLLAKPFRSRELLDIVQKLLFGTSTTGPV